MLISRILWDIILQAEKDDLISFREKWQKELQISTPTHKQSKSNKIPSEKEDDESKAKTLFIKGIEMEKEGKMYEAIQFYRRAVQIVPDIEFKVDITPKIKPKEHLTDNADVGKWKHFVFYCKFHSFNYISRVMK